MFWAYNDIISWLIRCTLDKLNPCVNIECQDGKDTSDIEYPIQHFLFR